jgi:hypothetical protein
MDTIREEMRAQEEARQAAEDNLKEAKQRRKEIKKALNVRAQIPSQALTVEIRAVMYCEGSTRGASFWKVLGVDGSVYILKKWNDNSARYIFGNALACNECLVEKMRIIKNLGEVIYSKSGEPLG